ncbi:MAG TPA: hypothetical protein VF627_04845 [Abditibacterium sp.]|jgi:hypothetical protein
MSNEPKIQPEVEPDLQEEPSPFSAPAPNQNGGPSSRDPNASALDANAPGGPREAFQREDAPNLLHYPGENFADGT